MSIPDIDQTYHNEANFQLEFNVPETSNETLEEREKELERLIDNMKLSYLNMKSEPQQQTPNTEEEQLKLEERFQDEMERIMNSPLNEEEEVILNFKPEDVGQETSKNLATDPQSESHKPLYDGAKITVAVSVILILTFSIRHGLSGVALADLLDLILLHCLKPVASNALNSIFHFKKYFQGLKTPLVIHKYCANCLFFIQDKADENICAVCNHNLSANKSTGYFIEIPIVHQLKALFSREGFYVDIQYRFTRTKKTVTAIEDIYDGKTYKRLLSKGLNDKHNISLTLNTDGIPVFKSSKFSLWPLYFVVNELSPLKRQRKENIIFAGLWFGPEKPLMLSYLQPFSICLRKLQDEGFIVESPESPFVRKVFLIASSCDLPAKCLLSNSIQFNGHCGCSKCLQPGETCGTRKGGHVHVYPFYPENPKGPERTHEGMTTDARQASMLQEPVNGIKGPCWLSHLKGTFDMVKGNSIDYTHGVLLGVTKLLLTLWFSPQHSKDDFSHTALVNEIDRKLTSIKPPNNITRMPRSISQNFKFWKASEFRAFLLFYGPIVLRGILDVDYYEHFMLLSEGIYILLKDSIEEEEIYFVQQLFYKFCLKFPYLYDGNRYCTMNVHQLVHLPDDVLELAGLWTHSCFGFEDENHFTLKLFHGTQNVEFQIATAVCIKQQLPLMAREVLEADQDFKSLYNKLTGVPENMQETFLGNGIYDLGSPHKYKPPNIELLAISEFLSHALIVPEVLKFARIRISSDEIHSTEYKHVTARNSYTVAYKSQLGHILFGKIMYFCQLLDDHMRNANLVILESLPIVHNSFISGQEHWCLCQAHHSSKCIRAIKINLCCTY